MKTAARDSRDRKSSWQSTLPQGLGNCRSLPNFQGRRQVHLKRSNRGYNSISIWEGPWVINCWSLGGHWGELGCNTCPFIRPNPNCIWANCVCFWHCWSLGYREEWMWPNKTTQNYLIVHRTVVKNKSFKASQVKWSSLLHFWWDRRKWNYQHRSFNVSMSLRRDFLTVSSCFSLWKVKRVAQTSTLFLLKQSIISEVLQFSFYRQV